MRSWCGNAVHPHQLSPLRAQESRALSYLDDLVEPGILSVLISTSCAVRAGRHSCSVASWSLCIGSQIYA